jgi:hypothetical protein
MRILIATLLMLLALPAFAADWQSYDNARFGYTLPVPPGFAAEGPEPDNGDGRVFANAQRTQRLTVWGGNVMAADFSAEANAMLNAARADGWRLSSMAATPGWTAWSGERNGIVIHARVIALCKGTQYAAYELTFPRRDIAEMAPILARLETGLAPTSASLSC